VLVAALQRQQAKEWNPIGTVLYFLYEVVTLIWPAGIVGAIIGGVLAFGLYWMFGVNAQFLVLIGFIIGWGRSIWVYPLFGGTSISTWLYLRKVKKVKP
jgi:ABC-type multidrug transport system permease subunit